MSADLVPLLWVCGTSGVGKSRVAWELFRRTGAADGDSVPTAYVDIDQLGMCYPALPDDDSRDRLKALNLGAVVANFRAAGAERILVSGVFDPLAARLYSDALGGVTVTWCQLNAAPETLRKRLTLRGWPSETIEFCLDYATMLDESGFAHIVVNTEGMSVPEVVEQVARDGLQGGRGLACPEARARARHSGEPFRAVLITGSRVVGKSTIAWEVYNRTLAAGETTAFLDLRQLSFFRPPPTGDASNEALKARNVAATWPNFDGAGARRLILNGEVERPSDVTAALPSGDLATYVLTASSESLRDRVRSRAQGGGPGLVGDDLPSEEQFAQGVPMCTTGCVTIDTSDLNVDEVASFVIDGMDGWFRTDQKGAGRTDA